MNMYVMAGIVAMIIIIYVLKTLFCFIIGKFGAELMSKVLNKLK